jgi:hypothetical protein
MHLSRVRLIFFKCSSQKNMNPSFTNNISLERWLDVYDCVILAALFQVSLIIFKWILKCFWAPDCWTIQSCWLYYHFTYNFNSFFKKWVLVLQFMQNFVIFIDRILKNCLLNFLNRLSGCFNRWSTQCFKFFIKLCFWFVLSAIKYRFSLWWSIKKWIAIWLLNIWQIVRF